MDESLTKILRAIHLIPVPYHTQLNICHDVALALVYLHSNGIIHRDLSSNNVLLIAGGSRAKVTDFGMSKLVGMNPRMTPLTMCPGTSAYMPPEALITPPRYSSKLDCFSHGVLTIQIITRQFPNPTDPMTTIKDPRYPTGQIVVFVPESDRRKKDIDLVEPNHPILPLALHCLKDSDTERLTTDEVCGRLATLKCEPQYIHSMERSREQSMSMQQQIQQKDDELDTCRQQLQRAREELNAKESTMEQVIADCQAALEAKTSECEKRLSTKDSTVAVKDSVIEQLRKENHELLQKQEQHNTMSHIKASISVSIIMLAVEPLN